MSSVPITSQIASHRGIPVHDVRNYIRKTCKKLHGHSKIEAVNKFLRP